jgi:hypothetical protein
MIGKTLALYEITSQLGKDGMGEVYQAKDQKLQDRKTISINRALFNQALRARTAISLWSRRVPSSN